MACHTIPGDLRAEIRARLSQAGATISSVARELGIDRATVRKYRADRAQTEMPATKPVDPVAEAAAAHRRRRELEIERAAVREIAGERSFRQYLSELVWEAAPRFDQPPAYRPTRTESGSVSETMLLFLSDWHAYETVKRSRVLDLNEYNAEIFADRVYGIRSAALSIREKMTRGGWRFPKLHIAVNGDMISGTIHEVERHSDAPHVLAAAFGCGELLACLIRDLAANFEETTVVVTAGNHGRLPDARRVQQKDPTRSWDYLIGLFARAALRDIPSVRFVFPDSYTCTYEVEGWRFYQGHGHDIKSWQSIPFYGISRAATGLNALRSAMGSPINYFLFSHFHSKGSIDCPGGEYFVNGSLIGGTEFSVNGLGRADRPCQWLYGVHPEHGVTHRWPLYADRVGKGSYPVRPWESVIGGTV